eukprot:ANDGO_00957.mRNA.1 hypothetical protein
MQRASPSSRPSSRVAVGTPLPAPASPKSRPGTAAAGHRKQPATNPQSPSTMKPSNSQIRPSHPVSKFEMLSAKLAQHDPKSRASAAASAADYARPLGRRASISSVALRRHSARSRGLGPCPVCSMDAAQPGCDLTFRMILVEQYMSKFHRPGAGKANRPHSSYGRARSATSSEFKSLTKEDLVASLMDDIPQVILDNDELLRETRTPSMLADCLDDDDFLEKRLAVCDLCLLRYNDAYMSYVSSPYVLDILKTGKRRSTVVTSSVIMDENVQPQEGDLQDTQSSFFITSGGMDL